MTLSRWQARELCRLYGSRQAGVRAAVAMLLSEGRRASRAAQFQEVQVMARAGSSIDSMLAILAAGAPTLGDLSPSGQHLDISLEQALYRALQEKPARRMMRRLQGATITTIGKEEGVTKQAIHKSLRQAEVTLAADRDFLAALCSLFPESSLTPELLKEVTHDR